MRVRLLNDGGFESIAGLDFPVEVEAELYTRAKFSSHSITVPNSEFEKLGVSQHALLAEGATPEEGLLFFQDDDEYEILEE